MQRFQATILPPRTDYARITKKILQVKFVIATQGNALVTDTVALHHPFQYLSGRWPTINVISEENFNAMTNRPFSAVSFYHCIKPFQQVDSAMDVADGIDPDSIRKTRVFVLLSAFAFRNKFFEKLRDHFNTKSPGSVSDSAAGSNQTDTSDWRKHI